MDMYWNIIIYLDIIYFSCIGSSFKVPTNKLFFKILKHLFYFYFVIQTQDNIHLHFYYFYKIRYIIEIIKNNDLIFI